MAGLTREQRAARAAQQETASADAPAASEPAAVSSTVRMTRDPMTTPAPHAADVHPDEVGNYAQHGWVVATE